MAELAEGEESAVGLLLGFVAWGLSTVMVGEYKTPDSHTCIVGIFPPHRALDTAFVEARWSFFLLCLISGVI
jgi:hypothetical protein